jgi:hypothetical protein
MEEGELTRTVRITAVFAALVIVVSAASAEESLNEIYRYPFSVGATWAGIALLTNRLIDTTKRTTPVNVRLCFPGPVHSSVDNPRQTYDERRG